MPVIVNGGEMTENEGREIISREYGSFSNSEKLGEM